MKLIKAILVLVTAGCVAVTGIFLLKVITVQRELGAKQRALLKHVDRQNDSVVSICGAFGPTEEMVGKTARMLSDLKALSGVVSDMNGLVARANELQATTGERLDASNAEIGGLAKAASGAVAPLNLVSERTAKTASFINSTVAALSQMAAGLASVNSSAADIGNMMEGKY